MNQNYKLTLYAVQVYGVRLSDYHEPRPVEILCNSEEEACRSIDWALFILNIIYSNHEKH